jgi:hypothetical protein
MKKLALYWQLLGVLLLFFVLVQGCSLPAALGAIQVIPNDSTATFVGQTVQYKAFGAFRQAGDHPFIIKEITNEVAWTSTNVSVSKISASGLATSMGIGSTTIIASLDGIQGTATMEGSSNLPAHSLTSLTVIPGNQPQLVVGNPAQFIAIGTFNTPPVTQDLTDQAKWQSSDVNVATINAAGLALLNAPGTTTITAIAQSNTGSAITGSSTITIGAGGCCTLLPILSVYEVGLGSGTVTSSDGVIDCTTSAASGAACTGSFVLNSTVTLTATPAAGSKFGGWSANCTPDSADTCSIVMSTNEPVGAIFNQ